MGSHAKTRSTGRKTALGALAVGATLTGVGLTAAALDPATAVLSADSAAGTGAAIQLSGLADPVAAVPRTVTLKALSAAPAASAVSSLTGSAAKTAGATSRTADSTPAEISTSRPMRSTPERISTTTTQGSTSTGQSSGQSAIQPIQQGTGALTTGYLGRHRHVRSAPLPSSDGGPAADPLGSDPLLGLLGAGSNPLSQVLGAGSNPLSQVLGAGSNPLSEVFGPSGLSGLLGGL